MTTGFLKHRIRIEPIEKEITKLLGETNEPAMYNQFYKDFARECYSILRKFYMPRMSTDKKKEKSSVDIRGLNTELDRIIEKWVEKGLNQAILIKVKDVIIKKLNPD
jgi:hypothetical protein